MQAVAFKAGDMIIAAGDEGNTAFFIVNGRVQVSIGQATRPGPSERCQPAKFSAKCA